MTMSDNGDNRTVDNAKATASENDGNGKEAASTKRPAPGKYHLLPQEVWKLRPRKDPHQRNWKVISSYDDYEQWSMQQWAWEFLRRNRLFQRDCDLLEDQPSSPRRRDKQLPPHWYLHGMKHYSDSFGAGTAAQPRWTLLRPLDIHDMNTPPFLALDPESLAMGEITLKAGQIAVVFDLNDATVMPELLQRQWETASDHVFRSLGRLQHARFGRAYSGLEPSKRKVAKQRHLLTTPPKSKLIDYLRVADAFSARFDTDIEEFCQVLHQEGRLRATPGKGKKPDEAGNKIWDREAITRAKNSLYPMIQATRRLIYDRGYLLLLAQDAKRASPSDRLAQTWPRKEHPESASVSWPPEGPANDRAKPDPKVESQLDDIPDGHPFAGLTRQKHR
jgi:hypothetical protein